MTRTAEERLALFTQVCYGLVAGYTAWIIIDVALDHRPSQWIRQETEKVKTRRSEAKKMRRAQAEVILEAMETVDTARGEETGS